MAITHVEGVCSGNNAVAGSATATLTSHPTSGNFLIGAGACFFPDAITEIFIAAPSGTTERQNLDAGGNLAALLHTKTATASGDQSFTIDTTQEDENFAAIILEVSGSNGYDTSGKATTNSGTELTITTDANVTANGSQAYLLTFGQHVSGYSANTPTGWSVIDSVNTTASNRVGAHLYKKDTTSNSGGTESVTWSRAGVASRLKGFIIVVGPGNDDPVLTVPGAQRYVRGKAHVISGVSAVDADNDESVVTLTCTHGTFAAPTPTNVDVAGENTASMTLTGTTTELNTYFAAGNGPTYTHSAANHNADTITINWDDQVGTADEKTIAVTAVDWLVKASNQTDLNAVLATLAAQENTAKTVLMTTGAEDSGGRTDSEVVTLNVMESITLTASSLKNVRRRRRQ